MTQSQIHSSETDLDPTRLTIFSEHLYNVSFPQKQVTIYIKSLSLFSLISPAVQQLSFFFNVMENFLGILLSCVFLSQSRKAGRGEGLYRTSGTCACGKGLNTWYSMFLPLLPLTLSLGILVISTKLEVTRLLFFFLKF